MMVESLIEQTKYFSTEERGHAATTRVIYMMMEI